MALTPGAVGRRYAPFLAIAAVQVLLVAVTPSRPQTVTAGTGATGTGVGTTNSVVDANGNVLPTDAAGNVIGGNALGAGLGASGSGAATGTGGGVGGTGVTGPTKLDLSHCDAKGRQIGWSYYMPLCAPVWHGGDNGGATMQGVTATEIRYVFYVAKGDPQVNFILAREGLAASTEQTCQRVKALHAATNKRYEFYGRHLVSLEGSNANSGQKHQADAEAAGQGDGGPCRFPYFQGNCSLTPPDPQCERAEARAIIKDLKPAYVAAPVADPAFYDELAKGGVIVSGGEAEPAEYHTQYPGYYYDVFMDGTRAARMMAEYWCKKLNGKPVQFGGPDVNLGSPTRRLGITWPSTKGDPTFTVSVNQFIKLITGKVPGQGCTDPTPISTISYESDINQAQQQAQTTVQLFTTDHVTTVLCVCDPIAPVFITANMDAQHYHPEHLIMGTGLIDYDVLGRLYTAPQWAHAFGISHLQVSLPFAQTDASRAWQDAGNTGTPDGTSNLSTAYYTLLGASFQQAGPKPTVANIQQGLFTAPLRGGWAETGGNPAYPKIVFRAPDDYTGINDAREVWWCSSRPSEIDGQAGSYVPIDNGHRYDLGEWPTGNPQAFVGYTCANAG